MPFSKPPLAILENPLYLALYAKFPHYWNVGSLKACIGVPKTGVHVNIFLIRLKKWTIKI